NYGGNLLRAPVREQFKPLAHEVIGNAHDLGEHVISRLSNPDVISQTLTHALLTVEAAEARKRDANLRLLSGVALQVPHDHQAKELLAAAQLDIGSDFYAVPALHQRIETFMQINGGAGLPPFGEIVAFQDPLHGYLGRKIQHV